MKMFLWLGIGIAGGIIGGMGMGGGTLLIPLLTLCAGVEQHLAQSVNLLAFLPMSAVALIIHARNKLVDFKDLPTVALPAAAASIPAAMAVRRIGGALLRRFFGGFLTLLGIWQLVSLCLSHAKEKTSPQGRPPLYETVYK